MHPVKPLSGNAPASSPGSNSDMQVCGTMQAVQFPFLTKRCSKSKRLGTRLAMLPDTPHIIVLLCLLPDDFTRQVESAATQWVNKLIDHKLIFTRR
jgi:hypothetical protein